MTKVFESTVAVLGFVALSAGAAAADEALRRKAASLFGRIEAAAAESIASPEAELGRALFWDERLSLDGKTSCGSCHFARDWGADRRRFSPRRGRQTYVAPLADGLQLDAPADAALARRPRGRRGASGKLDDRVHGFPSKQAGVEALEKFQYREKFRAAYPGESEPLSARNYGKALAAYQATLATPAPFDRFLAGEDAALDARQKAGLRAFIGAGCGACHSGPLLGGDSFQKFGVVKEYLQETGSKPADVGRFAVTKKEEDRYVFRVPMLRHVAKTAPYFHDGSVERLDRAVRVMASVQLGRTLDDAEAGAILRFLESLTGEVPAHYAPPGKKPALD